MCGIAGWYVFGHGASVDAATVRAMTRALAHRGPDDSGCVLLTRGRRGSMAVSGPDGPGVETRGHVGLGHRRLSIIDRSSLGRQPMAAGEGMVWLTYNGEIYNYRELRAELEARGARFRTRTDTEVVLESYLAWGGDCFSRFNGMWALALYDGRSGELILSRDRFGKKPLYYWRDGENFLFASEIKGLLRHPRVPREPDLVKVAAYAGRHYRYVDGDERSFFREIQSVPPRALMVATPAGITSRTYWRLAPSLSERDAMGEDEAAERFHELLTDAVRLRLRSDVPVGVMLSGGLDSTSITAEVVRQSSGIRAFSGITGSGYFDESAYIDSMVRHTGLGHAYVRPRPADLMAVLGRMLAFHDEPVCTVTWYVSWLITREIAAHGVPVILTGHGGDELLAGYWDHFHHHFADLRDGPGDGPEKAAWLANHGRSPDEYDREKEYLERLAGEPELEKARFARYLDCLSPELQASDAPGLYPPLPGPRLTRRLGLELFHETIPASLRAEDRNMMAFSLENRCPFLDVRLVEFCFGLDNRLKIRDGLGKWLLRRAMAGILPENVRLRKDKTGFNAPFGEWIRGVNRPDLEDLLARDTMANRAFYDMDAVRDRFREHLAGADHAMFFWQYVNLNLWAGMFF